METTTTISTPTTTSKEPEKRQPTGTPLHWLTDNVGWPFPTWVEEGLYKAEFKDQSDAAADLLVSMFHAIQEKISKALATDAADKRRIDFEWWRLPSDRAKKEKPIKLKATLYKHPDYGKVWMLVETA